MADASEITQPAAAQLPEAGQPPAKQEREARERLEMLRVSFLCTMCAVSRTQCILADTMESNECCCSHSITSQHINRRAGLSWPESETRAGEWVMWACVAVGEGESGWPGAADGEAGGAARGRAGRDGRAERGARARKRAAHDAAGVPRGGQRGRRGGSRRLRPRRQRAGARLAASSAAAVRLWSPCMLKSCSNKPLSKSCNYKPLLKLCTTGPCSSHATTMARWLSTPTLHGSAGYRCGCGLPKASWLGQKDQEGLHHVSTSQPYIAGANKGKYERQEVKELPVQFSATWAQILLSCYGTIPAVQTVGHSWRRAQIDAASRLGQCITRTKTQVQHQFCMDVHRTDT